MSNRIREVALQDRLDDPAEVEIWVRVLPENTTPTTEVRGRLIGPRCHYATTVEVAYPLRPFVRRPEGLPGLAVRVVIPEASLWEPESPFLYQGPIELWEEGHRCDQVQVTHGLRTLRLGPRGLRLNGRPLALQGVARDHCSEDDARLLRRRGCNLLLAPVTPETSGLWAAADRLGFLVLGQVEGSAESLRQARTLSRHVSCLGWLLPRDPGHGHDLVIASLRNANEHALIGITWEHDPSGPLPEGVSFLACPERLLASLTGSPLPRIVLTETPEPPGAGGSQPSSPSILGWISAA